MYCGIVGFGNNDAFILNDREADIFKGRFILYFYGAIIKALCKIKGLLQMFGVFIVIVGYAVIVKKLRKL